MVGSVSVCETGFFCLFLSLVFPGKSLLGCGGGLQSGIQCGTGLEKVVLRNVARGQSNSLDPNKPEKELEINTVPPGRCSPRSS